MLDRIWIELFDRQVCADAERLIEAHGQEAIKAAEFSAMCAMENKEGHWRRVAREIARRTRRRPI